MEISKAINQFKKCNRKLLNFYIQKVLDHKRWSFCRINFTTLNICTQVLVSISNKWVSFFLKYAVYFDSNKTSEMYAKLTSTSQNQKLDMLTKQSIWYYLFLSCYELISWSVLRITVFQYTEQPSQVVQSCLLSFSFFFN